MVGKDLLPGERKKKKSMQFKGVLDKRDLAEAYNCDTKKSRGKQHGGDTLSPTSVLVTSPVNAVEYNEAVIEDLLQPDTSARPQRRTSHHIYETARRLNEVRSPYSSHSVNNNSIHKSMSFATTTEISTSTPAGYEPENSLRRVSTASQGAPLKREGGIRRRSGLDRPNILPLTKQHSGTSSINTTYEPEDSLRRVKQPSDIPKILLSRDSDSSLKKVSEESKTAAVAENYEPENSLRRTKQSRDEPKLLTTSESNGSLRKLNESKVPTQNYEPENSLRRMRRSSDQPKSLITREYSNPLDKLSEESKTSDYEPANSLRRMRRSSDQPKYMATQVHGDSLRKVSEETETVTNDNKPENSLLRIRKASNQANTSEGRGRQRRDGRIFEDQSENSTATKGVQRTKDVAGTQNPESDYGDSSSPVASPKSSSNVKNRPPNSLSLAEAPQFHRAESPLTASPKPTRKISRSRMLPSSRSRLSLQAMNTSPPSSPMLDRMISEGSLQASSSPTSRRRRPSSTTTPTSTPNLLPDPATAARTKRVRSCREGASHINTTRYWEWYLLNASYSWKNFNTHKIYCY